MNHTGSYDRQRIHELRDRYREDLLNNTLDFWLRHGVDREFGGIMTCLNREGSVVDTDKGIWQQARFCWLLGELYNRVDSRPEWLEVAEATLGFIDSYGFDSNDGRMWFQVTREGQPLRKRRYAFSESFASIAYGELAKATGKAHYRDQAISCFSAFIKQMTNPVDPSPKWTDVRPTRSLGLPMITINTAQELRESIGWEEADHWIDVSIDSIRQFHLDDQRQCVLETVSPTGDFIGHSEGRTLNPGHAIEGAWFVLWEALHRQDRDLLRLGCQMLDWMWEKGWDSTYGGLVYFVDAEGGEVSEYWHDMKFWWPQNEAIIATLLAFVLTGDERYAQWHSEIHAWAHQWFPDTEHGEWYGYLHRDGRLSHSLKGTLWKGPFHLPRMQLVCWKLLDRFEENDLKPLMV
jgi:N-acylglucosamine 2-epimerase